MTEAESWVRDGSGRAMDRPDFTRVRARLERMRHLAADLDRTIDEGLATGRLPDTRTPALNDRLARLEQKLCDDAGVVSSRWYRHVIYGWNIYSLTMASLFPVWRQAIYQNDAARMPSRSAVSTRAGTDARASWKER